MKKIVFLFVSLFVMNLVVLADNDKPIQISQMPKKAQSFVQKYFADQSVAVAKMETDFLDKTFDVIFTNGDKVEFDKKGNWTKIDCEHTQVPAEVIPVAIQQYAHQQDCQQEREQEEHQHSHRIQDSVSSFLIHKRNHSKIPHYKLRM